MVRQATRLIVLLLAVLVACGGFLSTRPGKALVLRSLAASIRTRLGVEAYAADLDYRFASGGVTLYGFTVTRPGATRPFLSAERVEVDFSPGILLGRLAIRRLDVSSPMIVFDSSTRAAAVAIRQAAKTPGTLPRFWIGRLDLRDLTLTAGSAGDTQLSVGGLSARMAGEEPGRLRGTLVVSGGLSVRRSGILVRFDRARAEMALAGTSVSLTSITTSSPVASVEATARIDISRTDLDVKYHARIDLGRLRQWWTGAPSLSGTLESTGAVRGTLDEPVASVSVRGERLRWRDVADATVSASGGWSGGNLVIDHYDVRSGAADAQVGGRARLAVSGQGRSSSVVVEGSAGDLRHLAYLTRNAALPSVPVKLLADLSWPGLVPAGVTLRGRVRMAVLNVDAPGVPLAGFDANGQGGRWTVRHRAALAGGTRIAAWVSAVVDPARPSHTTIDGRIAAGCASAAEALRALRRMGFWRPNVDALLQDGRATADAILSGTLVSPRIRLEVTADSVTIAGIKQVRAEAQVHLAGRHVEIARATVASSGNRVDVHGTATIGKGPVDLSVEGRVDRPDLLAGWLPTYWRPTGSLALSGKVIGSSSDLGFAGRIVGSSLESNGLVVDTLDGRVTFAGGVIGVSDLRLNSGRGWLRLNGDIQLNPGHLSLRGEGKNLTLAVERLNDAKSPLIAGSPREAVHLDDLSLEFDIHGPPVQPTGTISAVAGDLVFEGRRLGPFTFSGAGSDGRTATFDLALQNHRAGLTGTVGFEHAWPFEAHASLRRSQLAPLLELLGPTSPFPGSTGIVTASVDAAGRLDRPLDSSIALTLSELEGTLRDKPLRLVRSGRIRFEGHNLFVEEPIRMTLAGFSIGVAPPDGDPDRGGVVSTLEGRVEDGLGFLSPHVAVTPPYLVEGPVRAKVLLNDEGNGVTVSGDADATIERLVRADQELARDLRLHAQARDGTLEVSNTAGTVLGGPFNGTASVPLSWILPQWLAGGRAAERERTPTDATVTARADVTLARTLQALAVTRNDWSGSAKVTLEARATAPRLENVEATLALDTGELVINNVSFSQQRPTRLRFDKGRLEASDFAWKGPRSELTVSGALGLLAGAEGELRADGTAALSLLRTIAPGAAGEAAFRVRVSGPPGSRQISATADLGDVSLIAPKQQMALAGLSGTLSLDAGVFEARGLRGQLNGGDLTIDGTIPVRAGVAAPRPLKVEGRGLFIEVPKGLRSQLDTSLTWESAAKSTRLSGQITIASDAYREPITALAALAGSLTNTSRASSRTLPWWVAATTLDIRLKSVGPLVVDQSVLKIEMVPDLQLTGTLGQPLLGGQVAIADGGRIQAGGRTYRLTDSRLEFSPRFGLLPRLNLMGETRVSSYLVTLRISGPANDIETNFSSDPPLSERDVRSLLVTGRTADPVRGATDGDRFAIGAVSGDVLGIAGQFVGLDSVRVGTEDLDLVSSDVNPATRLTVSKRLGSKFELVVSENLEESQSTWILIYRPIGGYEFRFSSEENTTQSLEFRQEITFGPGVSSRARVKKVAVVPDRVRSVTLAGEPGFTAAEVLAGTKIRSGDRFDFREWLNDRDRVARFYRDRQYFTARIVPQRTSSEAAGSEHRVDLQYRITRGPRTLLEVKGYSGDDRFMERMRQTWSENVLLDLLGDSLARAARDHLADAGFLRAAVEVAVDRPVPDAVRARIGIAPGPRTDSRRLEFSGNRDIALQELHILAATGGLEAEAWKDSTRLVDEIRAAYAARGHLAARAIAEPIRFSNGAAVLPIRIDEGPLAHVASLRLTGVAAERRSNALDAIALPVGSPFTSATARAARSRLERHYRDLGYRDVHAEGSATAGPGADVVLAFTVNEGPLHVIRSVEIAGVQSTRPSIVRRAVGLAAGEPAGAAAAAESERRLYELGTFRRAELRFEPEPLLTPIPGTVPVKAYVSVEEARRFQFRYGLELSSEYNSALSQRANAMGFAGDIRDRNFLGRGMSLGGGVRWESDLRSVRSLFAVPKLAGHAIRTNVYLTARNEEDTSDQQITVRDDEIELSIEQRWRVGRAIEYSWGYGVNWRDTQLTTSTAGGEPLGFAGTLASLNGAVVVDRRDSFFDAKRGWFSSVSLQWGERAFGSELDYLRALVRGSYYQPFGPLVLAGNVRWGRLVPLGGVPPLTVFDLFFNAGGTESVRGYSQDELTAYDFLGAPLGGTKLLVLNGELRSPLFWRLGGVLFVDAGNTFAETQAVRFDDLAIGLGVGLRINTPLAPVRIDLGLPRSLDKSGIRWHFSIGQMF